MTERAKEMDIKTSPKPNNLSKTSNKDGKRVVTLVPNENTQPIVRKSNDLVQLAMYNLSLTQQKLMLHIFSKIQPTDTELPEYEFTIYEFAYLCNINPSSGSVYKNIRKNIEDLVNVPVQWISIPGTNAKRTMRWIAKAETNQDTGKIHLWLDNDLKPHLIQLKSFYTTFNMAYTLPMRSQYSVRIYELCKSYQNLYLQKKEQGEHFVIKVDFLKQQVNCPYTSWTDIKRNVLDKAKNEINGCTDIIFDYREWTHKGRKVTEIILIIEKEDISAAETALSKIDSLSAQKKQKTKYQREIENSLLVSPSDIDEDTCVLPYVSAKDTTIPFSFGSDRETMLNELKIRAEYERLTEELSDAQINGIDAIIDAMASLAGTITDGQPLKEGGNEQFFEKMNNVILRCGSLHSWFIGVADSYAASKLPQALTKKAPTLYLFKIIMNDLDNYKIYTSADYVFSKAKVVKEQFDYVSDEIIDVQENEQNCEPQKMAVLSPADAETNITITLALKNKMDYEQLCAKLSKGQKQALSDIISAVAALCRRNQKGKDKGALVENANMTFIEPLNRVIEEYGSLSPLFEALAFEYDYDVYWKQLSENTKIKNPTQVFNAAVEKAIITSIGTIRAAEAKKGTEQQEKKEGPDPESIIGRMARRTLNNKK